MTPRRATRFGSPVELASAAAFDADELALVFTAGYQGYWVPIELDGPGFTAMGEIVDADLGLSRVATVEGGPAGIVLFARRGTEGWIGGMGVVARLRRRGIGEAMLTAALDAARAAGIERVTLEVLEQNIPARALYERLGFEHVRDLEVWSLAAVGGVASEVDAEVAHAWLRAQRTHPEPWQRDDASLAGLPDTKGLLVDGAAAVVRVRGGRVSVLQVGGERGPLRQILAGACSLGDSLTVVNLPAGHPAGAALEELGGRVDARQHELALVLSERTRSGRTP
jgi:ribosomal protein S18 acetylase RimI-like enzyme